MTLVKLVAVLTRTQSVINMNAVGLRQLSLYVVCCRYMYLSGCVPKQIDLGIGD